MTMSPTSHPSTDPGLDLDDRARMELRLGGGVIVVFFGLFLGWAAFAPLDAGAFAEGRVSVSGNRQAVQHRDGGVVSALRVAEGDRVRRGQVLIELNAGELRASERGTTGQVFALLAQRARLIAERDRLGAPVAPPEFADLPPADRTLAREAMRLQENQFVARRAARSIQTGVISQRGGQLNEQMAGYERQLEANQAQQRLISEELDGLRLLARQGYAPQTRVRALERTAAALEGEHGSLRAQIARTREQLGEARLQRLGVATDLGEDVAEQLRQTEIQLNELRPRLMELRDQLASAEIRSPATGQVVGLKVFTPGGVVPPGQSLMEIVPDQASQVIIAEVDPRDVDNVRVGQPTEIRFPGLTERNPPIIRGRVTRISADSFTDERTGLSHFRAEVAAPKNELRKLGEAAAMIRSGTPVQIVILTQKRTVLEYIVEPLTHAFWRSGTEQ